MPVRWRHAEALLTSSSLTKLQRTDLVLSQHPDANLLDLCIGDGSKGYPAIDKAGLRNFVSNDDGNQQSK